MKNRSVTLSLLTATLFAVPVLTRAETPAAPAAYGPRHAEMVKRFDRNGDSQIDNPERQAARAEMRQRWGAPRGHAGFGTMRGQRRAQVLHRFDHDHDGRLNDAEHAEAKAAREQHRAEAQARRQRMLSRFDRDGDGRIADTERDEMRAAWQKFIEQHPSLNPAAK